MKIHEYQAKKLLGDYGAPVPSGIVAETAEAARQAAEKMLPCVIKAQVHSGGRGKAGGVKLAKTADEAETIARQMLGMQLVTKQTGPAGKTVHKVLITEAVAVKKEYYLSVTGDMNRAGLVIVASSAGGTEIEETAKTAPEAIVQIPVSAVMGLKAYEVMDTADRIGLPQVLRAQFQTLLDALVRLYLEKDCSLVEINPLGVIGGKLVAMDSKFVIDDHARAARDTIAALEEARLMLHDYKAPEKEATTVTYVPLSGNVGMISDGAGTGMLTLDLLTDAGLDVACFTELGGMTSEEVMYRAMQLTLEGHDEIQALMIVLIGGFNRMDNMARGITSYVREHNVQIPIFTRMCGTMEEEGIRIMQEAGLSTYYDLTETVEMLRKAVKGE